MTGWGAKSFYRVEKVRLDLNPIKAKFNNEGTSVSVKRYFLERYNIDLDPG